MNPLPFLRTLAPRAWLYIGLGAALIVAALWLYLSGRSDGKAAGRVERAEQAAEAVTQARKADEAADTAVAQETASVAVRTEAAREAARESDDPLVSAFEKLRKRP